MNLNLFRGIMQGQEDVDLVPEEGEEVIIEPKKIKGLRGSYSVEVSGASAFVDRILLLYLDTLNAHERKMYAQYPSIRQFWIVTDEDGKRWFVDEGGKEQLTLE